MEENRYKRLAGNTLLFAISSFSGKLLSLFVQPYITHAMDEVSDVGVTKLTSQCANLLIPLVGITYEFNRAVGSHDNKLTRILSAPGMWMQNFTTFEPDDGMLEVAIEALKQVLPAEEGKDQW